MWKILNEVWIREDFRAANNGNQTDLRRQRVGRGSLLEGYRSVSESTRQECG